MIFNIFGQFSFGVFFMFFVSFWFDFKCFPKGLVVFLMLFLRFWQDFQCFSVFNSFPKVLMRISICSQALGLISKGFPKDLDVFRYFS